MAFIGVAAGLLWVVMVLFVVAMCRAAGTAEAGEDTGAGARLSPATG
jgi:hypothetical protein